jgi:hypothetical protein
VVVVEPEPVLLCAEAGRFKGTTATLAARTLAPTNLVTFEIFMIKLPLFMSLIYRLKREVESVYSRKLSHLWIPAEEIEKTFVEVGALWL